MLASGSADAAAAQRLGHSRGDVRELDQLALTQLRVGDDDPLAGSGEVAAAVLLECRGGCLERERHRSAAESLQPAHGSMLFTKLSRNAVEPANSTSRLSL